MGLLLVVCLLRFFLFFLLGQGLREEKLMSGSRCMDSEIWKVKPRRCSAVALVTMEGAPAVPMPLRVKE